MDDEFRHYPLRVPQSSEHPERQYERQDDLFAVHHAGAEALAAAVLILDDGRIAVLQGSPADYPFLLDATNLTPVYRLQPQGPPAVPTGLVLLRYDESITAVSRTSVFMTLGYRVAQTLDYAPHAIWLSNVSGNVADALNGVLQLAALADVVNVEPQMIAQAVRR